MNPPQAQPQILYYAVVDVLSGSLLYLGRSLLTASERLLPGTVYGKAETRPMAVMKAAKSREQALRTQINYSENQYDA